MNMWNNIGVCLLVAPIVAIGGATLVLIFAVVEWQWLALVGGILAWAFLTSWLICKES